MPTRRELDAFLAKQTKSSCVLYMLLTKAYVTSSDIIAVTRTTCPHKLIETIRKTFGYEFVSYRDKPFTRTQRSSTGKVYKVPDTYREYFIPEALKCA